MCKNGGISRIGRSGRSRIWPVRKPHSRVTGPTQGSHAGRGILDEAGTASVEEGRHVRVASDTHLILG